MIFIAANADASGNNLGQIVIKSVDDISPSTASLLNLMGKTWTDEQKVEIDNFLEKLALASWSSKIKLLVLPILMPAKNGITNSDVLIEDSIFDYNIATLAHDLTPIGSLLLEAYGYLGINENGFVLQNGNGGNMHANLGLNYNTMSLSITNKSAHQGVYYLGASVFAAGMAATSIGYIAASVTGESAQFYNSFKTTVYNAAPHSNLLILNGDVNLATGKSYVKDSLVDTVIVGSSIETIQAAASPIFGGTGQNVADESTCCLMTFGDYLEDDEIAAYSAMINILMDALIV